MKYSEKPTLFGNIIIAILIVIIIVQIIVITLKLNP